MLVADVMTRGPSTVSPETSLRDAAAMLLDQGVSGLPVADEDGKLVGIITEADFVAREAERDGPRRHRILAALLGREHSALASADQVGDVMATKVETVSETDTVAAVAHMMLRHNVKRLPVIDEKGRLVGIVSRADVVKSFVRDDASIVSDVEALLANRVIIVEPGALTVSSEGGVVALTGEVDTRSEADALAEVVAHLDGVLRVDNRLSWKVDDDVPEEQWPGFSQEGADR
jgi:CBS domain-containing protein